ncbi:MAG TPA: hypothetical protein PLA00_11020 [Syntrophorhabdaceae bacterium]|nr:hypothetical protein [Syntrophorhabdaceae bacterium]
MILKIPVANKPIVITINIFLCIKALMKTIAEINKKVIRINSIIAVSAFEVITLTLPIVRRGVKLRRKTHQPIATTPIVIQYPNEPGSAVQSNKNVIMLNIVA